MAVKKSRSILMTEGVIWKQMIAFSIPLLIGNIFQQLYNTVDSVVVGNYIGSAALAAVGSSNSLINLIVGLFMGIATGSGVVIAQYYGARDGEKMHWAVHTAMTLSMIGGFALIFIGIWAAPFVLRLMGTPEEVMPNSVRYLQIFFCGSLFNLVYNMGAGILRAVGDSKRPLYFLCVASVLNIVLDLLFVVVFHMGVEGVGYATIISQGVSAAMVVAVLVRSNEIYRLELKKLRIDTRMMKRILYYGIPTGIQQAIISMSNVIVQANINSFGATAMAGCSSYMKIDGFVMLPLQSFNMAAMTFTGQNIGAKKMDRVKKGIVQGIVISFIYTVIVSVPLYIFAGSILKIFTSDANVNYYGVLMMHTCLPFYLFLSVHQVLSGALRGAGKSITTMFISVGNMCVLRIIYLTIFVAMFPRIETVMWCYPVTWVTTLVCELLYMWKGGGIVPKERGSL